ncbi:MAG: CPBP family intramembrane metalloprotease [Coriobacteriia bacterium]|nr:CPBP family intramembrane metalloprotease [Coriobacteriia bacterium]
MKPIAADRTDSSRDTRRLALYFGGLIVVYAIAVAAFWNAEQKDGVFLAVMFAPTAGALLARFAGPGVIRWGRPNWWMIAGLIPAVAALLAYYAGSLLGLDVLAVPVLLASLVGAPMAIASACISAVGEEIGWRGFLWPLLRGRRSFLMASLFTGGVWWVYHVPLILFGWYGQRAGIPAFTVAIIGFTLFVGVLADRSKSVWPSVIAHGAWNALVSTGFEAVSGTGLTPAFTGSTMWVGEFGWLAAIASLIVGVSAAVWHLRQPGAAAIQSADPTSP